MSEPLREQQCMMEKLILLIVSLDGGFRSDLMELLTNSLL